MKRQINNINEIDFEICKEYTRDAIDLLDIYYTNYSFEKLKYLCKILKWLKDNQDDSYIQIIRNKYNFSIKTNKYKITYKYIYIYEKNQGEN